MPPEKTPAMNVPPPPPPQSHEHHYEPTKPAGVGPIIGIVIIIVMLLVGALYMWGKQLQDTDPNLPAYIPGDPVTSTTSEQ